MPLQALPFNTPTRRGQASWRGSPAGGPPPRSRDRGRQSAPPRPPPLAAAGDRTPGTRDTARCALTPPRPGCPTAVHRGQARPARLGQIQPLGTGRSALHPRPATHLHASRGSRRNSFHAPNPPPRNETREGRRAGSAPDPALRSACQAPGTSSPPEPALPAPVQPAARRRCSGRRRAGEKASDLEPRAAEHAQSAAEPGRLPARRWSVPPGVPGGRGAGTADARPGTQLSPAGQLALGCGDLGGWGSFSFLETGTGDAGPYPLPHPIYEKRKGPHGGFHPPGSEAQLGASPRVVRLKRPESWERKLSLREITIWDSCWQTTLAFSSPPSPRAATLVTPS
uniref:formin-like protein 14 n=1 Tax=Arvicanthis niloticus TaxID=61156 RepID=UPI00148725F3|nr:formin-like protein 14 [Arvicanthis niloticus]